MIALIFIGVKIMNYSFNNWYISNWSEVKSQLEKNQLLHPTEKTLKDFDYVNKLINLVNQIVRFDDFFPGLDQDIFNHIKITDGVVGIMKDGDTFVNAIVQPAGLPGTDGRPYKVIATYIIVKDEKPQVVVTPEIEVNKDIVLFYNTAYGKPDYNILWLAKMLGETDISIYKNIIYARYAPLLRGKSEKEKKQLEEAIDKIVAGELSILVSDDTFEDLLANNQEIVLNVTDVGNSDKIQYLSHLYQDFIKRFTMDYGCPISGVEKMAQQNNAEINGDVAYSWLVPIDMLNQAKLGVERCKELWPELTIEAHFGTLHELMYMKFAQDITKDNPNMNLSIEENQNIEDLEPSEMFEKVDENINSEESIKQDSGKSEESIEEEEVKEEDPEELEEEEEKEETEEKEEEEKKDE